MIEELIIRGFKSYPPSRTERIIFTRGVNKISGRNAAGKTSLLEAIVFGLYGDVPGVTKQSLVPLGEDNLNITVAIRSPFTGQRAVIHREGALNKDGGFRTTKSHMIVEGEDHAYSLEKDIQSRLRELVGIGKNTFLNIVYAKQKEFIEILNPNKTRMDAILGLTTPAEIREEFKEVKRMLSEKGRITQRGTYEERIRNAEAAVVDGKEQLEEANTRKRELEDGLTEKKARLYNVKGRVEDLEIFLREFRRLENLQSEIGKLQALRDERNLDLESILITIGVAPEKRLRDLRVSMEGAKSTEKRLQHLLESDLEVERNEIAANASRLRHQINEHTFFKDKGLTVCPTCGQEIDYELIENDIERWQQELLFKEERLSAINHEIKTILGQIQISRDRWINDDREISELESLLHRTKEIERSLKEILDRGRLLATQLENKTEKILEKAEVNVGGTFSSIRVAEGVIEDELKNIRAESVELQGEVKSREDRLRDEERRIGAIQDRISRQKEILGKANEVLGKICEYEAKIKALEKIQERYSEYETTLRENTLTQLEYQTYQYFRRITDQHLYGNCHIDRERYTLEVYPVEGLGKLPAWRAGGGHESLFALAERLAMLRVMGFTDLLILDEPTDAVDSQNIPQLLEYIARSSQELGQVLLVTHHGYGEEEGVNLINVRKDGRESRVIQEDFEIQEYMTPNTE